MQPWICTTCSRRSFSQNRRRSNYVDFSSCRCVSDGEVDGGRRKKTDAARKQDERRGKVNNEIQKHAGLRANFRLV